MVIKIYVSELSGNKEVKKRQQRVLMILESKNLKYVAIDITAPGQENLRAFMQENSTNSGATTGDQNPRHPLPPQIFNDDIYCGDFNEFDLANENDTVEEFLKIERSKSPEKEANSEEPEDPRDPDHEKESDQSESSQHSEDEKNSGTTKDLEDPEYQTDHEENSKDSEQFGNQNDSVSMMLNNLQTEIAA